MTHLDWTLLFILSEWAIRIVMLPVVMHRRQPSTATAWLVVIYFEPYIGLALYWLFGANRLPRRRIQRHAEALEQIRYARHSGSMATRLPRPDLTEEQWSLVGLAEQLGEMTAVSGNDVSLMTDTREVIDTLIADIDAAERHVHLLFYIYDDDATGEAVGDALIRAEQRGVECRVLADEVGSWHSFRGLFRRLEAAGVEVRAALPVNPFRRKLARIDLRNHRKIAVIDGRAAYTGSQNIVDPTYGSRDLIWHDAMLRITGPIVLDLQRVFVEDWYFETGRILDDDALFPEPVESGDIPMQCLPSGPSYTNLSYQRLVVAALHMARSRVTITSPYLAPDESVMVALQLAVLRGVQVDVIVPRRSDQRLAQAVGRSFYDDLLDAGVHLYLHRDGLLHAKIISVDETFSLVGSSNFDIRSFYLNFELNMLLFGPDITSRVREQQERYITESQRLTEEEWDRRPGFKRYAQSVARLLSPLV